MNNYEKLLDFAMRQPHVVHQRIREINSIAGHRYIQTKIRRFELNIDNYYIHVIEKNGFEFDISLGGAKDLLIHEIGCVNVNPNIMPR